MSDTTCGRDHHFHPPHSWGHLNWCPGDPTHHDPACDIPDCGLNRCADCDERMTCLGPEPRACTTTCVDCPCACETCVHVAQDMRDDLMHKIEKEAF